MRRGGEQSVQEDNQASEAIEFDDIRVEHSEYESYVEQDPAT